MSVLLEVYDFNCSSLFSELYVLFEELFVILRFGFSLDAGSIFLVRRLGSCVGKGIRITGEKFIILCFRLQSGDYYIIW